MLNHEIGAKFLPSGKDSPKAISIKKGCFTLAAFLNDILPEGKDMERAIDKLQEVMFWSLMSIEE